MGVVVVELTNCKCGGIVIDDTGDVKNAGAKGKWNKTLRSVHFGVVELINCN